MNDWHCKKLYHMAIFHILSNLTEEQLRNEIGGADQTEFGSIRWWKQLDDKNGMHQSLSIFRPFLTGVESWFH